MAIQSSDILFKLSVKTGSAGNSTAGTTGGSLGGYISTTQITDATLHNLFDAITGDENAASDVEYRCFFVHNSHATLTLLAPVVWLSSETSGGAAVAIAVDATAASAVGWSGPPRRRRCKWRMKARPRRDRRSRRPPVRAPGWR